MLGKGISKARNRPRGVPVLIFLPGKFAKHFPPLLPVLGLAMAAMKILVSTHLSP